MYCTNPISSPSPQDHDTALESGIEMKLLHLYLELGIDPRGDGARQIPFTGQSHGL